MVTTPQVQFLFELLSSGQDLMPDTCGSASGPVWRYHCLRCCMRLMLLLTHLYIQEVLLCSFFRCSVFCRITQATFRLLSLTSILIVALVLQSCKNITTCDSKNSIRCAYVEIFSCNLMTRKNESHYFLSVPAASCFMSSAELTVMSKTIVKVLQFQPVLHLAFPSLVNFNTHCFWVSYSSHWHATGTEEIIALFLQNRCIRWYWIKFSAVFLITINPSVAGLSGRAV